MIVYRHFESKAGMYQAVLDRACTRLAQSVGTGDYDDNAIPALLRAAAADADGFRLLFRYAGREPEFRDVTDTLTAASTDIARRDLAAQIPEGPWLDWAARLIPAVTIEAVLAWLDSGQPDPDQAADRVGQLVHHVIQAAHAPSG